jgi:hypothetical protein
MLQAFGIPFFALLLGGGSGAALRSAEHKTEEDLPIRPSKRVFAAYIVSLFYLIILTAILFAASTPLEYSFFLQMDYAVPLIIITLLPLHSAAFVFSYWLSQALLGAIVSLMSTILPAYYLYLINGFDSISYPGSVYIVFRRIDLILLAFQSLPSVIATIIHLIFMTWIVNSIEREKKIWLPLKAAVAVLIVTILSLTTWVMYFTVLNFSDPAELIDRCYEYGAMEQ